MVWTMSFLSMRRSRLANLGPFPPECSRIPDWHLILAAIARGFRVGFLDEPLVGKCYHEENLAYDSEIIERQTIPRLIRFVRQYPAVADVLSPAEVMRLLTERYVRAMQYLRRKNMWEAIPDYLMEHVRGGYIHPHVHAYFKALALRNIDRKRFADFAVAHSSTHPLWNFILGLKAYDDRDFPTAASLFEQSYVRVGRGFLEAMNSMALACYHFDRDRAGRLITELVRRKGDYKDATDNLSFMLQGRPDDFRHTDLLFPSTLDFLVRWPPELPVRAGVSPNASAAGDSTGATSATAAPEQPLPRPVSACREILLGIDAPVDNAWSVGGFLDVSGWLVNPKREVAAVLVGSSRRHLRTALYPLSRPDVAHALPNRQAASISGFTVRVPTLGRSDVQVVVEARLRSGESVELWRHPVRLVADLDKVCDSQVVLSRLRQYPEDRPVFVLGAARSGTTALRSAIESGAACAGWGEGHVFPFMHDLLNEMLGSWVSHNAYFFKSYSPDSVTGNTIASLDMYEVVNATVERFVELHRRHFGFGVWVEQDAHAEGHRGGAPPPPRLPGRQVHLLAPSSPEDGPVEHAEVR